MRENLFLSLSNESLREFAKKVISFQDYFYTLLRETALKKK
jgi:hypothetical protein